MIDVIDVATLKVTDHIPTGHSPEVFGLSRDEKTLYITNGPTMAAFDVQPDGSCTNMRTFATLHGGEVQINSEVDKGTKVTLIIPASESTHQALPAVSR